MNQEIIAKIVETSGDYRQQDGFVFDVDHVTEWVNQFPERSQDCILRTVSKSLEKTYFSTQGAKTFFKAAIRTAKLNEGDASKFWPTVNFLNIQSRGHSQKEMLVIFDSVLKEEIGVEVSECGSGDGHFIYLDDGLFSGGHIISDVKNWINGAAPNNAQLHIIVVALYSYGEYYSNKLIRECIAESGKKIDITFWRALLLENSPNRSSISDVYWPTIIPEEAANYVADFRKAPIIRVAGRESSNKVFDTDEDRIITESEFTVHGLKIRDACPGLNKFQRPLGNSVLDTLGFGSTFVSFRNCPNNAPLVYWAGNPWYPLFPRKTNTDTALLDQFDEIWG